MFQFTPVLKTSNEKLTQDQLVAEKNSIIATTPLQESDSTIRDIETYGPSADFWQTYLSVVQTLLDLTGLCEKRPWICIQGRCNKYDLGYLRMTEKYLSH